MPGGAVSPSWRLALAIAYERAMVFGQDIVFTFGPLGALDSWMYWPSIYLPSLVFWAVLSGLAALLLIRSIDDAPRAVWFAAGTVLFASLTPDTALMLLPWAYCVDALHQRRRGIVSIAALLCLSTLVLIKATLIPLCLLAVVCSALLRDTKPRWTLLCDLALLCVPAILWWHLLRQPLSAVWPYLSLSFEVTRGYAQAMSLPTRDGVAFGLGLCGLGLTWLLWQQVRTMQATRWQRLAWPSFAMFTMLVAWRHSVTRGDGEHLVIGLSYFGALAFCAATFVPLQRRLALGIASLCLIGVVANIRRVDSNFMNGELLGRVPAMVRGLTALAHGQSLRANLDAQLREQVAQARTEHPSLNALSGGFDILGYDHDLLLAADVSAWTPRPVFQSYSAYTLRLAELNARFLASDAAPRWLIAPVQTIDGRLPTMDDPTLWPLLRSHYRVRTRDKSALLLERKTPVPEAAPAFDAIDLPLTNWTALPSIDAGAVYARLQFEDPAWRRALASLWQPAQYYLEYRSAASAKPERFRVVPEIARSGFLLLPILQHPDALADWIEHPDAPVATKGEVRLTDRGGNPIAARLVLCASLACAR